MRNVFAIFVEQMQNIVRYSAELEGEDEEDEKTEIRYGVLSIGIDKDKLFVACGNKIHRKDVAKLNQRLAELRTADKQELKDLYVGNFSINGQFELSQRIRVPMHVFGIPFRPGLLAMLRLEDSKQRIIMQPEHVVVFDKLVTGSS